MYITGNPIPIGAAKNKADQIAKDHDIGYSQLIEDSKQGKYTKEEFHQRLSSLDEKAIQEFKQEYKDSGSWNAYIGKKGLQIKKATENITGPLYPKQQTTFTNEDLENIARKNNTTIQHIKTHLAKEDININHKIITQINNNKPHDLNDINYIHKIILPITKEEKLHALKRRLFQGPTQRQSTNDKNNKKKRRIHI